MKKIEGMDALTIDEISSLWSRNDYVKGMTAADIRRHLTWKYHPDYACVFVERLDRTVVGTCGYIRTTLLSRRGDLECRWGMDSLIDKDQRGLNTNAFLKLMRVPLRFNDVSRQILLCFPNHVVRSTYLKIGMRPLGDFARYRYLLNRSESSAPSKSPVRNMKDILSFTWKDGFFDPAIGELSSRLSKKFLFLPKRDMRYLRWRYNACPTYQYKVLIVHKNDSVEGFLVLRIRKEGSLLRASIIDLLCDPDNRDLIHGMFDEVNHYCREREVDHIVVTINHAGFVDALTQIGYVKEMSIDLFCWAKDKILLQQLEQSSRGIHITAGDGDYDME